MRALRDWSNPGWLRARDTCTVFSDHSALVHRACGDRMANNCSFDECKFAVENRCFRAAVDVALGLSGGAPKKADKIVAAADDVQKVLEDIVCGLEESHPVATKLTELTEQ